MLKKQVLTLQKQLEDKLDSLQKDYNHFSVHTTAKLKVIDKTLADSEYKNDSRLTVLETHDQITKENLDSYRHKMQKHIFDAENIAKEHEGMYKKALKEVKIIRVNNESAMSIIALN